MRIKLLIMTLAFSLSAIAQGKSELDVFKHHAIDSVQLMVSYRLSFKHDRSGKEKPEIHKVYTYIGHNVCHSFVEAERNTDLKMAESMQNNGKRGSKAGMKLVSNIGETYSGYPKGKTTVIYNMDGAGSYLYEEVTPKMHWKFSNENKTVLGYNCTAATCSFRGRNYKAWFTSDVPLSYGPWKFVGLPGLIMEIETEDGDYHWVATGIEKPKTPTSIYFLDRTYVRTSREKTRKQEKLLLKDPAEFLQSYGYTFTATNFSGQTVKLKLFTFDNPLETE